MNEIVNKLTSCPLLNTLPLESLNKQIEAKQFHVGTYEKGHVIHFEDDVCKHLEVVLQGELIVERIDEDGNLLAIREFNPGDILGGNLIFSKSPYYPMTITALSEVTLLMIPKDLVFELCSSNEEFFKIFLELMSDYALILGNKIKQYVRRPLRKVITAYLKHEYLKQGTKEIKLTTTKKALAESMGVERTSLSRELQKMKQLGLITYSADTISITDPSLLK